MGGGFIIAGTDEKLNKGTLPERRKGKPTFWHNDKHRRIILK
jgi:hypothetical protein